MSQQSQPGHYNLRKCKEHYCACQDFREANNPNICYNCTHDAVLHLDFDTLPEPHNLQVDQTHSLHTDRQDYINQRHQHQPVREQPPPNTIWFYNRNEAYYEFTNFKEGFPINVAIGEQYEVKKWPTSEHLFQAAKFKQNNPEIVDQIRNCRSPRDALNLARLNQHLVDPNWQERNVEVMKWVVKEKFKQHPKLASMLLSTGDFKLVEHTNKDRFWGDGGDESGLNWLGRILMEVREELKTEFPQQNFEYIPNPLPQSNFSHNAYFGQNGSEGHIQIAPKLPPRRSEKRDLSKFDKNPKKNQQNNKNQNQQFNESQNSVQYMYQPQPQPQPLQHYQPIVNQEIHPEIVYYIPYNQQDPNNPNM